MEKETNWKYIVYCTVNIENNKIYVGIHKCIDPYTFDGYIGCGCYINQPYTYQNPKTAFQFAVKKYGPNFFKRTLIKVFDTIEEASELEAYIVNEDFLKREDVYNMIPGGIESIGEFNKIKVFQYSLDGKFLREFDSYKEASIFVGNSWVSIWGAVKRKGTCCNSYWSTDKMQKLDLSLYKVPIPNQKKIFLYDFDGNYIDTYDSITKCGEQIGVSVSETCHAAYFGYKLRNKFYVCFVYDKKYDKARKVYTKNRKVYKYDENGNFIAEYTTQEEAEKKNPTVNIDKFIKNKKPDKLGCYWRIFKLNNIKVPDKGPYSNIKVYKYDSNNNLIKIFNSKTAAAKEDGSAVWQAIDKTIHKGFTYVTKPIKEIV